MMSEGNKVSIFCNHGGDFVLKSGKFMYEGGTRRLIRAYQSITHCDLLSKVNEICTPRVISTIKYSYPGTELNYSSLVSIINDEDVSNMMEVFPLSLTPIDLYAFPSQSPSNSISIAIATPCPRQGLDNGATPRVLHENVEAINSSSQIVNAYSKDGDQSTSSHLHKEACAMVNIPRQDLDSGTVEATSRILQENNETTTSSPPIYNAYSNYNEGSALVYLQEEDRPILENERLGVQMLQENNETVTSSPQIFNTYGNDEDGSTLINLQEEDRTMAENERLSVQPQPLVVESNGRDYVEEMNYTLSQGQEFQNAKAFDMALREHAIRSKFEYNPIRSDQRRISAKCHGDGCPWYIRASKVHDGSTFKIKALGANHTCKRIKLNCENHRQASENWIANFIVRHPKHLQSKPKDIMKRIALEYGIKVNYHKARRGRELALEELEGDCSSDLSAYCDEIKRTNPGSFATLGHHSNGKKLGIFIAYHASICGFLRACRPIITLYSSSINGMYPRTWLFASGLNADNKEFLLAYAIVDSSNQETWTWFCIQLASILEGKGELKITIVTKRHEKSSEAVGRIFSDARQLPCTLGVDRSTTCTVLVHHRYCRESLYKEFCQKFDSIELKLLFNTMLFTTDVGVFDTQWSTISSISPEAQKWIDEISPSRKNWALSHFDGQDYERAPCFHEFDNWINEANFKNSSVILSLKHFHRKMMELFSRERVNQSLHLETRLRIDGSNELDYCEYYTMAKYREAYSELIHPISEHI